MLALDYLSDSNEWPLKVVLKFKLEILSFFFIDYKLYLLAPILVEVRFFCLGYSISDGYG